MILLKKFLLIGFLGLMLYPKFLRSENYEFRNYISFDYKLFDINSGFKIKPFVKLENRFRDLGSVLAKFSTGLKMGFTNWFNINIYYSNKGLYYSEYLQKNLLNVDLVFLIHLGNIGFKSRHGNEWHINDRYYRYRNYSEIYVKTDNKFGVFVSEEFRADSDEKRVNQNDLRFGSSVKINKSLKFTVFLGWESKRRHSQIWHDVYYLGFSTETHL